MLVTQSKLTRKEDNSTINQVVWLPKDVKVKEGTVISLDKDDRKWLVEEQYATTDSQNLHQGWGLDLPKTQRTER